jgi:hypothetical protein
MDMIYDHEQNRWTIDLEDCPYGLHCGESLTLVIGSIQIPCRIELGSEWFIVSENVRLDLRKQDTYRVLIET